jgi:hypothetical protein
LAAGIGKPWSDALVQVETALQEGNKIVFFYLYFFCFILSFLPPKAHEEAV